MKGVTAIIISRQGSSRLPGKAMIEIMGKPVLSIIIDRLKNMPEVKKICVATSNLDIDKPILQIAEKEGVMSFAGHPDDVLDRLYYAAKVSNAEVVYEVGGDCPLVDRDTLNKAIVLMEKGNHNFVHNFAPMTYPDGLDCPLMTFDCLEQMHNNAVLPSHRIHPFSYIFSNPEQFSVGNFTCSPNYGHFRLTLDYEEDLILLREIFERLYSANPKFTLKDVIDLLDENPSLAQINAQYVLPPSPEAYWNTLAYIDDMHDDLANLILTSKQTSKQQKFALAVKQYNEVMRMVGQLKERAQHLLETTFDETDRNL